MRKKRSLGHTGGFPYKPDIRKKNNLYHSNNTAWQT